MGRFQNTEYINTVNGITNTMTSLLDNSYYQYNDKKPYILTYFHINEEYTTLDEGSKQNYAFSGSDSPIYYDKIINFVAYGTGNRIEVNLNREDFGLMADTIEGELAFLPNTIRPYPGDLFTMKVIDSDYALFKVTEVNIDTINNGNNIYRIRYNLESNEEARFIELRNRIVHTYHMIIDNVGTNYRAIIEDDTFNFINNIDDLCVKLKLYFKSLFYSTRVQTFIYKYINDQPLYDPFMIEFLINNNILDNDGQYIYVCHQMRTPNIFPIVYNNTFFRCVELKDLERIRKYKYRGKAQYIKDIRSIFQTRQEDYFWVCYDCCNLTEAVIPSFRDDLIYNIENNIKYEECKYRIFNIIIKYFWDEEITQEDIDAFDCIGYDSVIELFYTIPIIIFCLEYYINKSIATTNSDEYCKLKLDINKNNKCDNSRVIDDRPNI